MLRYAYITSLLLFVLFFIFKIAYLNILLNLKQYLQINYLKKDNHLIIYFSFANISILLPTQNIRCNMYLLPIYVFSSKI